MWRGVRSCDRSLHMCFLIGLLPGVAAEGFGPLIGYEQICPASVLLLRTVSL